VASPRHDFANSGGKPGVAGCECLDSAAVILGHGPGTGTKGFFFFNNIPVAVRVCQQDYSDLNRKVLILNWDIHYGNDVQNIFYNDPNILYISCHVYQNGIYNPCKPTNTMTPEVSSTAASRLVVARTSISAGMIKVTEGA
jgi:hypothetical protein